MEPVKTHAYLNLLSWGFGGYGLLEVNSRNVKWCPSIHSKEDMLLPLVRDDLLQDGTSDLAKGFGADQGLPALQVVCLHLILLVFEEDVLLKKI